VLNAVPFPVGLGYVYLGRWWRVAGSLFARVVAFVAGVILGALALFTIWDWYVSTEVFAFLVISAFLGPQVIVLALMIRDAWRLAGDSNGGATSVWRSARPLSTSPRREPFRHVEMEVANAWRG